MESDTGLASGAQFGQSLNVAEDGQQCTAAVRNLDLASLLEPLLDCSNCLGPEFPFIVDSGLVSDSQDPAI